MKKANSKSHEPGRGSSLTAAGFGMTAMMLSLSPQVSGNALEEVIVTAQKRAQSLQDIPFSISAKTGEDLAKRGATGFGDYLNSVPGVNFKDLGPGINDITIRGASGGQTNRDETARKTGVGVYFDESPVSLALFNPDLDSFDIERVEVLRGPQGTLYGSGSLSGTIRIITNKPTTESFHGTLEAGVSTISGGDSGYVTKGAVNIPLSDRTAVRLVSYHNEYGGFIDRVALESPTLGVISPAEKNVNSGSKSGGRITLRTEADDLTATFGAVYQKTVADGFPLDDIFNVNIASETGITGALPPTGKYGQYRPTEDGNDDEFLMFNATLEFALDNYDIVSATTFLDRDIVTKRDQTLRGLAFGLLDPDVDDFLTHAFNDRNQVSNFTQEVRLVSSNDSDWQWIVGTFYQKQSREYHQVGDVPGLQELTGLDVVAEFGALSPDSSFDFFNDVDLEQFALFGEVTWSFTDTLSATLGLRYFDFDEEFTNEFHGFFTGGNAIRSDANAQEDGVNPRFVLSYAPNDDFLFSAQASRGFRLGSSNPPIPDTDECNAAFDAIGTRPQDSFDSEILWNYELGAKMAFADNRLIVNAAIFHIDYEDIHMSGRINDCAGGLAFVSNAGEATIDGVEVDVTLRPLDGLDVVLSYAHNEAELSSDLPEFVVASVGDIGKGDPLPGSPENTFSASVNYNFPLTEGFDMYVYGDYSYVDDSLGRLDDDINPNLIFGRTRSYNIASARVGLLSADDWEVSAYVNNLTDEVAELALDVEGGGAGRQSFFRNTPRTYGLSFRMHF